MASFMFMKKNIRWYSADKTDDICEFLRHYSMLSTSIIGSYFVRRLRNNFNFFAIRYATICNFLVSTQIHDYLLFILYFFIFYTLYRTF